VIATIAQFQMRSVLVRSCAVGEKHCLGKRRGYVYRTSDKFGPQNFWTDSLQTMTGHTEFLRPFQQLQAPRVCTQYVCQLVTSPLSGQFADHISCVPSKSSIFW